MRVLLTTDTVGGVWTFTRELTEGLLRMHHTVALISFGRAPSAEQRDWANYVQCEFASCFMYRASEAPLEWMQDNARTLSIALPMLLELIERFQPDILHSSQFCFGSLPVSIPKLITAHSDVLSWAAACIPGGMERTPWLDRYISLVQHGLDGAEAVCAPTEHMLKELCKYFNVSCTTRIIQNGRSLPPTFGMESKVAQAVSVGRLWDQAKGYSTLLEVESPVPVLIAGEDQFESIRADTAGPQIRTLGILSEADLLVLFRQSSVYLALAYYEPFGLAPLEAALCGCAVVARDIPSLREVWGNAASYFRTAAELERDLLDLFVSPSTLRNAQVAATERAAKYTAARMVDSYLAIYDDLIQRASPAGLQYEQLVSYDA